MGGYNGTIVDPTGLNKAQYKILNGAIEVSEKKMEQAMQNWNEVRYTIDFDTVIDDAELIEIRKDMFSRKPIVLDKHDERKKHLVIGVLLSKSLIGTDSGKTLRQLYLERSIKVVLPIYTSPERPLFESIVKFEAQKSHAAIVYKDRDQATLAMRFAKHKQHLMREAKKEYQNTIGKSYEHVNAKAPTASSHKEMDTLKIDVDNLEQEEHAFGGEKPKESKYKQEVDVEGIDFQPMGLLTYENVIEVILGRQVEDEFDQERINKLTGKTTFVNRPSGSPSMFGKASAVGASPKMGRNSQFNNLSHIEAGKKHSMVTRENSVIDMKAFQKNLLDNIQKDEEVQNIIETRATAHDGHEPLLDDLYPMGLKASGNFGGNHKLGSDDASDV